MDGLGNGSFLNNLTEPWHQNWETLRVLGDVSKLALKINICLFSIQNDRVKRIRLWFSSGVFTAHDSVKQFTPQCLPNITKPQIQSKPLVAFHGEFPKEILLKITPPKKKKQQLGTWVPTPGRLTWNLRIHPWKRKIIFQCPSCSSSMLIFQGVHPFFWTGKFLQGPWGPSFSKRFDAWSKFSRTPEAPHHTLCRWPHLLWIQGSLGPRVAARETPQPPGFLRGSCLTGITSPLQTGGDYPLCGQPLKVIFWATK